MRKTCCQLGVPLGLPQLGEDFGPASLGSLLLRNGIVCACEARRNTILAGVCAFANAFYFASVTAAGSTEEISEDGPKIKPVQPVKQVWLVKQVKSEELGTYLSQALLTGAEVVAVDIM
jgi:hypothetical protein